MAKVKKAYFCKECGYEAPKWMGRCPACGEWNTFTEEIVARESGSVPAAMTSALPRSTPQRVGEIRLLPGILSAARGFSPTAQRDIPQMVFL